MSRQEPPQTQTYIRSKDVENRASLWRRVIWRVEALAWDILYWGPLSRMSPERASDLAGRMARRIGPFLSHHKVALDNLRRAYPNWDEARIEATALEAWESAGRTAGELPHLPRINPYSDGGRVEVINPERLDTIPLSGKGAVLISGHFANWEIMAAVICKRPVDCLVTYRAINNPHIDRRLNTVRRAYGIGVLTPKGLGTRSLMSALKAGRAVALLNDQKFREGLAVPFFGRMAMTAQGPARLAMKYDVPIIPISTVRTGAARFRVTVHAPIVPPDTGHREQDLLATVTEITGFIEARVRETPGQWFWMHRRWPKHPKSTPDP